MDSKLENFDFFDAEDQFIVDDKNLLKQITKLNQNDSGSIAYSNYSIVSKWKNQTGDNVKERQSSNTDPLVNSSAAIHEDSDFSDED